MTNLLPLEAQASVWRGYLTRIVTVLAIAVGALAVLFALALVPSVVALRLAAPTADEQHQATATKSEQDQIGRMQTIVHALVPILASTSTPASVAIAAAVADVPTGVSLENVFYTADDKSGTAQMTLTGTASRESIAAFKKTLADDPLFSNVFVPVGALVGSKDTAFSITLSVARPTN